MIIVNESSFQKSFDMKFGFDDLFLTDDKIRHVIQIDFLVDFIFLFQVSNDKDLNQYDVNDDMKSDKSDTKEK